MRTKERPILAGTEPRDGRYYVCTSKGNTYDFENPTDDATFFGSDLLADLLEAEREGEILERETLRLLSRSPSRLSRDVYDIVATLGAVVLAFIPLTAIAYLFI
jgi:hypothetical protein